MEEMEKLERRIEGLEDWLFKTHPSGRPPGASRLDRLEIAHKQLVRRWTLIGGAVVTVVTTVFGGAIVYLLTHGG